MDSSNNNKSTSPPRRGRPLGSKNKQKAFTSVKTRSSHIKTKETLLQGINKAINDSVHPLQVPRGKGSFNPVHTSAYGYTWSGPDHITNRICRDNTKPLSAHGNVFLQVVLDALVNGSLFPIMMEAEEDMQSKRKIKLGEEILDSDEEEDEEESEESEEDAGVRIKLTFKKRDNMSAEQLEYYAQQKRQREWRALPPMGLKPRWEEEGWGGIKEEDDGGDELEIKVEEDIDVDMLEESGDGEEGIKEESSDEEKSEGEDIKMEESDTDIKEGESEDEEEEEESEDEEEEEEQDTNTTGLDILNPPQFQYVGPFKVFEKLWKRDFPEES